MIVRGALSRAAAMAAIKKSEAKSEEDVRVIYTLFHFLRKPTRICIKLFNALVLRSAHARRLHLPAAKFMDQCLSYSNLAHLRQMFKWSKP